MGEGHLAHGVLLLHDSGLLVDDIVFRASSLDLLEHIGIRLDSHNEKHVHYYVVAQLVVAQMDCLQTLRVIYGPLE